MSISHRPAHTQLAYRVLFWPSSTQDYLPCLEDLVPAFPTDEPWVEKMISKMDKPQARQWKAWAQESNFSATAPRKGLRF